MRVRLFVNFFDVLFWFIPRASKVIITLNSSNPLQSSPTPFESVYLERGPQIFQTRFIAENFRNSRDRGNNYLAHSFCEFRLASVASRVIFVDHEFTTITRLPSSFPFFIFVSRTSTSVEGWRAVTLNAPWRLKSTRMEGDSRLEKAEEREREREQATRKEEKRRSVGHRPPWKHSINDDEKKLARVCETDFRVFFTVSDGYVLIVDDKRLSRRRVRVCDQVTYEIAWTSVKWRDNNEYFKGKRGKVGGRNISCFGFYGSFEQLQGSCVILAN